jgi:quercetin dioxygenase-like cupin family protein
MALKHARAGEVVDVGPLGPALSTSRTTTLLKTGQLEVVRLVLAAGKEIPEHEAPGELVVQCLEGRIAFTSGGTTRDLAAGQLLYLDAEEPHAVRCLEDASVLLTILLNRH